MNIDISKIKFEEFYNNMPFEEYTLYFIAPKNLVKDKHPEAEHSTISLDIISRTAMISPTKDGIDYDWYDIELDNNTMDELIALYASHVRPKVPSVYKLQKNNIFAIPTSSAKHWEE